MPAAITLESVTSEGNVPITELRFGSVTFGREPENSIVINSTAVSRRHGIIAEAGSQWIYRDFGTTNGSWVNDVPVREGQIRLIRPGDHVLVSDFPVVVSQIDPNEEIPSPSILVFFGERFESEFSFLSHPTFCVGGEHSNIEVDESPDFVLSVSYTAGRLELTAANGHSAVVLNSLAVATGGTSSIVDRDEISVGPYKLVINDLGSAGEARKPEGSAFDQQVSSVEALHSPSEDGEVSLSGWESEAAKRKAQSGHKFVFGSPSSEDEDSPENTISMGTHEFAERAGFEMNASQRLAALSMDDDEPGSALGEKIIFLLLGLVVLVLLGFLIYLLLTFTG